MPNSVRFVTTNGTQLSRFPNILDLLVETKTELEISLHNENLLEQIEHDIDRFIIEPLASREPMFFPVEVENWQRQYENIRAEHWPDCNHPNEFANLPAGVQEECVEKKLSYDEFVETSSVKPEQLYRLLDKHLVFHQSSLKFDEITKKMSLHNSDPEKAIAICDMKHCHHMIDGKVFINADLLEPGPSLCSSFRLT